MWYALVMFESLEKLCVKLNGRCNFNCLYCHQPLVEKTHKDFDKFEQLETFLQSLDNYEKEVEIVCGGGEPTLVPNLIRKLKKITDRLEKTKDISVNLALVTNGSRLNVLNSLIQDGILDPRNVGVSWDGDSHTRQSDTSLIDSLSKYDFCGDVNVTYAITPLSINNMVDDFKKCWDYGVKDLSYYFIHEGNYDNVNLQQTFKHNITKLTEEFLLRKQCDEKLSFFNFVYWHYCKNRNKPKMCTKLGKGFSVGLNGKLYPCIYFGDHHKNSIGDIYNGLDESLIKTFLEEYNKPYTCQWKECKNNNCQECPASNSVHNGGCSIKTLNVCKMHTIEREVYSNYPCKVDFDEPMFRSSIPAFMVNETCNSTPRQEFVTKGILSPALMKVRNWNE